MTLALLEPRSRGRWALTFYLTEAGRAEACPSFVCSWREARDLIDVVGALQMAERVSRLRHADGPAR